MTKKSRWVLIGVMTLGAACSKPEEVPTPTSSASALPAQAMSPAAVGSESSAVFGSELGGKASGRPRLPMEVEPRRRCTLISDATLALPDPGERFDLVLMTANLGHHRCLDGRECDGTFKDLDPVLEDLSTLAQNVAKYAKDRRFVLAIQGAWAPKYGEESPGTTRMDVLKIHLEKHLPGITGYRDNQYGYFWWDGFTKPEFEWRYWDKRTDTFDGYLTALAKPRDPSLTQIQFFDFRFTVQPGELEARQSQMDQLVAGMRLAGPQVIAVGDTNAQPCFSTAGVDAVCNASPDEGRPGGCRVIGLSNLSGRREESVDWVNSRLRCDDGSELFAGDAGNGCADIIGVLTTLAPTPLFTQGYWAPVWFPHDDLYGTTIKHLDHTVSIVGFRHVAGASCSESCAGLNCGTVNGCECGTCEAFQQCKSNKCIEHRCERGWTQCPTGRCVPPRKSCGDDG